MIDLFTEKTLVKRLIPFRHLDQRFDGMTDSTEQTKKIFIYS